MSSLSCPPLRNYPSRSIRHSLTVKQKLEESYVCWIRTINSSSSTVSLLQPIIMIQTACYAPPPLQSVAREWPQKSSYITDQIHCQKFQFITPSLLMLIASIWCAITSNAFGSETSTSDFLVQKALSCRSAKRCVTQADTRFSLSGLLDPHR